ncbi:DUF4105 domain-containing protein [Luteimonas sp. BDR2-5]|nr:DUF4105 domain-containing protein [Luteimonas sp. BDR2-5]MCD9029545.1 DUF4105 domain-containing protein [Luteimonas sp. BDR2-5]
MAGTLLVLALALWGTLALWYQAPSPWRWPLLLGWSLLAAGALAAPWQRGRRRRRLYVVACLALTGLLAWWWTIAPSHDREWADDVARLLEADVRGNMVTLRNVRNFDWRSDSDYAPRWETRRYELDRLVEADLILSYWMGPHVAHTLVSFGFDDGRKLVFSLEIRKERPESFSALGGFFRKFEAVIIAADESDIVRVRSNARGEDVYLYRLDLDPAALRTLFLGYLEEAEGIRRQPRFYNTLSSNCTTIVFDLARRLAPSLPIDYRLLLSGHFAEYAHDHGGLVPGYDYAELQARGRIGERARAHTGTPGDFPHAIRQGIPGADPGAR